MKIITLLKSYIGLYSKDMKKEEKLYEFRGKVFPSDEKTIRQLNYALSLNKSEERYKLVDQKKQIKNK